MATVWVILSHLDDEASEVVKVCKSKESAISFLKQEFDRFVKNHYEEGDDEPSFILETNSGFDLTVEFHDSLIYTAQESEIED